MSFVTRLFSRPKQQSAPIQQARPRPQAKASVQVDEGQAFARKRQARRRSGTQTKFGGALDSSTQATSARKSLLGE